MKRTHGGVLLFVLKVPLLHGRFSHFQNRTNGTKSRNASDITEIHYLLSLKFNAISFVETRGIIYYKRYLYKHQ